MNADLFQLQSALATWDLDVSLENQQQMLAHLQLLAKWNQHYNLTAITEFSMMLTHHLLDSLSIARLLKGNCFLDVGSGAGFPGIPLALCYPNKYFVLLDSNGKKTRFLQQVVLQLKLSNVEVVQERVENFSAEVGFDGIIFRAVGEMASLIVKANHLLAPQGSYYFMKGNYPTDELAALVLPYQVISLHIPGLFAQRHLVIVEGK